MVIARSKVVRRVRNVACLARPLRFPRGCERWCCIRAGHKVLFLLCYGSLDFAVGDDGKVYWDWWLVQLGRTCPRRVVDRHCSFGSRD